MSDTPRTDAARWIDEDGNSTVDAETSRQLERDLAAAKAKLHEIALLVEGYVDGAPDAGPVASLANAIDRGLNKP